MVSLSLRGKLTLRPDTSYLDAPLLSHAPLILDNLELSPIYKGVTKRCRLSWLTNSALVDEPKCGGWGGGGVAESRPMSTAVHMELK